MRIISQDGIEIGQKFGMLTVIDNAEPLITGKGYKYERFLCRCDCGKEKLITKRALTIDRTNSCGCIVGKSNSKDITGIKFGRLTAVCIHGCVKGLPCLWSESSSAKRRTRRIFSWIFSRLSQIQKRRWNTCKKDVL